MSKYDNSRFYWLQLKEDFFDDDAIDWLEDQPNGEKYSLFYLKLCLKSLKTNGILIRNVGKMLVPYDHIKLGELTKTDPDTVIVAMELFFKLGLVQKLENGELYMLQVENMIGSQSIGAFKKQQQIMRRENNLIEGGKREENIPPNIDIEKDIELDIKEKSTYVLKKKENEETNEQNEKQKEFFEVYPNIVIDNYSTADYADIDFAVLLEEFALSSKILQKKRSFKWICSHWAEISKGSYRDWETGMSKPSQKTYSSGVQCWEGIDEI